MLDWSLKPVVLIISNYKGSKTRRNEKKQKNINNKLKHFCNKLSGFGLVITNHTAIHTDTYNVPMTH